MMNYKYWVSMLILVFFYTVSAADEPECNPGMCEVTEEEHVNQEITKRDTLTVNDALLHDRWYNQVIGRVEVFDAPNGNVIRIIEDGFNFVTVLSDHEGWSQINSGEYVQSAHLRDSHHVISNFTGVLINQPDIEPFGWILVNLYPSPAPGEEPLESLGLIYRYTIVTLLDQITVNDEVWYQIDEDKWIHQYHVSIPHLMTQKPIEIDTTIWIIIDLYEQNLIVYNGDVPVFATLISSGLPRWPTYEGLFHIYFRNPREYMSWGTVGDDFYSLEEVPWTMFFDHGRALHGAYWHDGFGYRRSHGCVNLSITDAKWLFDYVASFMGSNRSSDVEQGPAVYVYSSGTYR